jgi:hypothetical protein
MQSQTECKAPSPSFLRFTVAHGGATRLAVDAEHEGHSHGSNR